MNPSSQPADLPPVPADEIELGLLRELYVRSRESVLVGILPIALLVWAHLDEHGLQPLMLWAASLLLIQAYRLLMAQRFLNQSPEAQSARTRHGYLHLWAGTSALAAGWVASFALLHAHGMGPVFYLHMVFLISLATFMLSTIGIDVRLYAAFLTVVVIGTLAVLFWLQPDFMGAYPVVPYGFLVYAGMLLVRSRGEHRRMRQWLSARITRQQLLEQLNAALIEEREMREALHRQSQELESRNRDLSELAVRDSLTRVFRRGYIEAELRRLIKSLHREHGDFCVLMVDIDFFKRVNDTYGHAVGDDVLRRLAIEVQAQLRAGDLFGRWGGEEFIVLMPATALPEAVEAAQRLRHAIGALQFNADGTPFQITISIGAAQLQPQESADGLVGRADEALYAAKHAGRDRVMAAPPNAN